MTDEPLELAVRDAVEAALTRLREIRNTRGKDAADARHAAFRERLMSRVETEPVQD